MNFLYFHTSTDYFIISHFFVRATRFGLLNPTLLTGDSR
nr:MAG TPA: hypothetical protein [Caudoviricetes sp.]DAW69398.1 MAG TPA: hypothetical protein [Caudoviricetes sp.]